jgi:hypothetical protein
MLVLVEVGGPSFGCNSALRRADLEEGRTAAGSGAAISAVAEEFLFFEGDQLLSFFSFLEGEECVDLMGPAQELRAIVRMVPATERLSLLDRSS